MVDFVISELREVGTPDSPDLKYNKIGWNGERRASLQSLIRCTWAERRRNGVPGKVTFLCSSSIRPDLGPRASTSTNGALDLVTESKGNTSAGGSVLPLELSDSWVGSAIAGAARTSQRAVPSWKVTSAGALFISVSYDHRQHRGI